MKAQELITLNFEDSGGSVGNFAGARGFMLRGSLVHKVRVMSECEGDGHEGGLVCRVTIKDGLVSGVRRVREWGMR